MNGGYNGKRNVDLSPFLSLLQLNTDSHKQVPLFEQPKA